ncbi:hypothetical protein F2P81_009587 [Scophthalmus maximus]|uniref:Uncharacterized protein n=1 Tax=Scophthalmus maximus TaxID=52904 RepID=A0A6A4SZ50_SCOMX|nr:hypothetical protein F2P81_009587 [Scophthalmus maximus]
MVKMTQRQNVTTTEKRTENLSQSYIQLQDPYIKDLSNVRHGDGTSDVVVTSLGAHVKRRHTLMTSTL